LKCKTDHIARVVPQPIHFFANSILYKHKGNVSPKYIFGIKKNSIPRIIIKDNFNKTTFAVIVLSLSELPGRFNNGK
jgi:hypothetical protein